MRIVFLGTGEIAVPSLRFVIEQGPRPTLLVTQPDRPAGRHQRPMPPAVKDVALRAGVAVLQPESLRRDQGACERIAAEAPDVIVVMAFGQILPKRLLAIPRVACINLHASLLPRHRGAACIQAAIDAGDPVTGMTVMHVAPQLDSGDVIAARETPIHDDDTAGSLHDRLAAIAPELLGEVLTMLGRGDAPRVPQDEEAATYIGKLGRDDGRLDWSWPAHRIERRIRAYDPWPGTFTTLADSRRTRLKVFPRAAPMAGSGQPGEVIGCGEEGLVVACGEGALRLDALQADGGRRMSGAELARGGKIHLADRLGCETAT